MSLTGALSNALSGLTANARAASIVSSNISNALTEGYGRRELELSPSGPAFGGGVRIDGVTRHGNPVILADRRVSDAETASVTELQGFAVRMEMLAGDPSSTGSLGGRMAALENALITAASNPASTQRLDTLSRAADDLAKTFNTVSHGIQASRQDADRGIRVQVEQLNDTLARVETLNTRITAATRLGREFIFPGGRAAEGHRQHRAGHPAAQCGARQRRGRAVLHLRPDASGRAGREDGIRADVDHPAAHDAGQRSSFGPHDQRPPGGYLAGGSACGRFACREVRDSRRPGRQLSGATGRHRARRHRKARGRRPGFDDYGTGTGHL